MKRSNSKHWGQLLAVLLTMGPASAMAQSTVEMVKGDDGQMYRVTRQTVSRTVPVTEYQTREEKVYRPRTTTEYQPIATSQTTPVTEYRWVSRQRGWWNPFIEPYWTHQLEPFTRWEQRPATVHVPTTRTDWVEEKRSVQIPVTSYKTVQEEYTQRVAVSAPTGVATPTTSAPLVATAPASGLRWGGERLDNDPPRTASRWEAPVTSNRYR